MVKTDKAERIVRDMRMLSPYMYEGLYGSFLRIFMESDVSKWTSDLSKYLQTVNQDWDEVSEEIALVLWQDFEKRISC
jgi:hypothetical protein